MPTVRNIVAATALVAGMASTTAPASANQLLAFQNSQSTGIKVKRDPNRPLVVIGRDADGNRVAQVFEPHATTPSKILRMDGGKAVPYQPSTNFKPSNFTAFQGAVNRYASQHGVDVALVRSVIQAESAFNPKAVSPKGAQGLMQLMPATAKRFGVTNSFDPEQNIEGGVRYLSLLLKMFDKPELAVAAYNAGEGAVQKYNGIPPYKETQNYVVKVMDLWRKYRTHGG